MAMVSGSISRFDPQNVDSDIETIRGRLTDRYYFQRTENNRTLNSIIQLSPEISHLRENVDLLSGVVYDEHNRTSSRVINRGNNDRGLPNYVIERNEYIDVRAGFFWITNTGFIITDIKANRGFLSNILHSSLRFEISASKINIAQFAQDFRDNWIGGIVDREGHWQKGTLYGEDLRQDSLVGTEFEVCSKNQVGAYTGYFGGDTKFKVTKDGVVVVYTTLEGNRDSYIRFIIDVIQPFLVN
jgi:hypothetical protein